VIKSTDANGWTVYNYGTHKQYGKRVTFSQAISTAAALTISSDNLPIGVDTLGAVYTQYSYIVAGSAFNLSLVMQETTSGTSITFAVCSIDGNSNTYTGYIDLLLSDV
jgi:hypothetical protein